MTYLTVFGLLAVTGLRVGEAIARDRRDVDSALPSVLLGQALALIHKQRCCLVRDVEHLFGGHLEPIR